MIEVKQLVGKMDLDSSPYKVAKEDYIQALNITKDAVEGSNDVAVTNIVGNRLVANPYVGKFYNNPNYNLFLSVFNNGNGTQNVRATFSVITGVAAIVLEYFDGAWIYIATNGGGQNTLEGNIPVGNYEYRFTVIDPPAPDAYYLFTLINTEKIKCIGAFKNGFPNSVYFIWSSLGYHQVLEFNSQTRIISKIFINIIDSNGVDVLGFTENEKINNINIYYRPEGDLLYFLDSLDRPTYINIARFKAGEYTPVTRQILDTCTAPPLQPPLAIYANDNKRVNNLRNKLFRFKYRWVYDDNQKSTYSPISAVPLPLNILNTEYNNVVTNNNKIILQFYSGAKNIKAIEIAVSVCNKTNSWSDFATAFTYNKGNSNDDKILSYDFFNDSTYPLIELSESLLLYDYVPPKAKAQEMPNGNVLMFGAITEGYNNDLVPNVIVTVPTFAINAAGQGSLTAVTTKDKELEDYYRYNTTLYGIPAVGTVIELKIKKRSDNTLVTGASYTTISGDTVRSVALALQINAIVRDIFVDVTASGITGLFYDFFIGDYFDLVLTTITPPVLTSASNSIATWKWSTERNIGIVYFDQKGRTNGVVYNSKVTFPSYAEDISNNILLPYVNVKIYNQPPIWANSYQFLFTKEPTQYIFWNTLDALEDSDFVYLDVTNFVTNASKNPDTATVCSYSFQDGDRLRLIKNMVNGEVYADTYDASITGLVVDPTINNQLKTGYSYIKINKVAPFTSVGFTTYKTFIIEIYRVGQQQPNGLNQVYYELGQQNRIINPETANRVHAGTVTNQSLNLVTPAETSIFNGDSYFRLRTVFNSAVETGIGYASFYVQDRNFLDIYTSAVSSVDGRPNIIDINAREAFYGTLVRYGQAYQANTNINGFNRFYSLDFDEYDYSYGNIVRFSVRDKTVRVFQELKVGQVPLFSTIVKDPTNNNVTINTTKLLNPIQYYIGDCGIGQQAESLASFNYADYFTTNIKGVVARVSNDGIRFLSIDHKINSWSTQELPLRTGNRKVYGVFDQRLNNYILALEAAGEISDAVTISFDEENNCFESFLSAHPEMMCDIGTLLITFKNGKLYTHDGTDYNTFYGTTYDSTITPVFNQNQLEKKTYLAISEVASEVWNCPEITTSLNSYGTTPQQSNLVDSDFETKEGVHHAGFLRDSNSIGGIINGNSLKGNWLSIKFRKENPINLITLNVVSLEYIDSPLSAK
jgi:hypothetical protein